MHSLKVSAQLSAKTVVASAMLMAVSTAMGTTESSAGDWQYGLKIYGWVPSVSGDLRFSPPGSSGHIDVDADKIIDALQMTFMGSFEVRKGPWSGFTDLIYLKLSDDASRSVTVPGAATPIPFDADMELKGWIWTLGGSYSVWRDRESHLDLLAGARLLALDADVDLTGGGPLQLDRKLSKSVDVWDGIVGAKGRIAINDNWFLPYYFDVGTGDSDLTWQAAAGAGYAFDWGEVSLMYRYLAYDQSSEKLLQDFEFDGPMLGVAFRF